VASEGESMGSRSKELRRAYGIIGGDIDYELSGHGREWTVGYHHVLGEKEVKRYLEERTKIETGVINSWN